MINAWHLVWIIPAVAAISFCFGAMLASGKEADQTTEAQHDECEQCMCHRCPFNPCPTHNDNI